jgi:biopolymer transport protein ExbD
MRLSRRAKRMSKNHERTLKRNVMLNMVSLMDIFTILVFFLLVNTTSTEVLPSPKNIVLPEASAEKLPARNLVIAVDERVIRLQGQPIILVKDAINNKQNTIRPLFDALRLASTSAKNITDRNGVTIMGDQEIPYGLLKKIMLTCAGAQYTNISFAVNQKAPDS